jgi:hypothetical protein
VNEERQPHTGQGAIVKAQLQGAGGRLAGLPAQPVIEKARAWTNGPADSAFRLHGASWHVDDRCSMGGA